MVLLAPATVGWLTHADRAVADGLSRETPRGATDERTVQCRRYNEELEGLERAPTPGAKGQDIFNSVSKRAGWSGRATRRC